MKKVYISPSIEIAQVENEATILTGSIEHNVTSFWGNDPDNPEKKSDDESVVEELEGDEIITLSKPGTGWGSGWNIWGRGSFGN